MEPRKLNLSQVRRGTTFASGIGGEDFGSYSHENLVLYVRSNHGQMLGGEDLDEFLRANSDQDVRAARAMQDMAFLHELRHFHDCFGTMAGVTLFASYLVEIREFLLLAKFLRHRKIAWKFPATSWARETSCPDEVRYFVARYERFRLARDLFLGRVVPIIEPAPSDETWRWFELQERGEHFIRPLTDEERYSFPAFPLHLQHRVIEGSGDEVVVGASSHWYPLGFECVVEGNAQALQRSVLEALWPDETVQRVWQLLTRRVGRKVPQAELPAALADHARHMALPYNITDYLITKHLGKRGIKEFPRRLVTELGDTVLMQSLAPAPGRKMMAVLPGAWVVELLESMSEGTDLSGTQWTPQMGLTDVGNLIKAYRRALPSFQRVIGASGAVDPITAVEAYVMHEIVIPLLELRTKYGHQVFSDTGVYAERVSEFPMPPLIETVDGFRSGTGVPDAFATHWAHFVMLQDVMRQILDGEPVIACARAYQTIPGLRVLNLCQGGTCDLNVSTGACKVWYPGRLAYLPNCLFSHVIRMVGLESITAADG